MKYLIIISFIVVSMGNLCAQKSPDNTLTNLQKAYAEEVNAAYKYYLYSIKAEVEGYHQVAKLFSAAYASENIHSINHQEAILSLGGIPQEPKIEDVEVRSTENNLRESIKGEANDWKCMYPAYIEEAKKEKADAAILSFSYAKDTETGHEDLFKEALINLGNNQPEDYYVGNVSGETIEVPESAPAPQSDKEGEEFIKIDI